MTGGPPTPYGPGLTVPNGRIPAMSWNALSRAVGIATARLTASVTGLGMYSGFHGPYCPGLTVRSYPASTRTRSGASRASARTDADHRYLLHRREEWAGSEWKSGSTWVSPYWPWSMTPG